MKNRVTVTIADQSITLLTDGDEAFTRKVAQHVDDQVKEIMSGGSIPLITGVILAAMNISESYFKELEGAENLRRQLKEYLEESSKLKMELSEARREIFTLNNKK